MQQDELRQARLLRLERSSSFGTGNKPSTPSVSSDGGLKTIANQTPVSHLPSPPPSKTLTPPETVPPPPPNASPHTPGKKSPEAVLSSALARVLHLTLKKREARAQIIYLDELGADMGECDLNHENMDAPLCAYLSMSPNPEGLHPLTYLIQAHARCVSEMRSARIESVKASLRDAATLLCRYAASLLVMPDMFGDASSNGNQVLCKEVMRYDGTVGATMFTPGMGGISQAFLTQLLLEVDDQDGLEQVTGPLFDAGNASLQQINPQAGLQAAFNPAASFARLGEVQLHTTRAFAQLLSHKPTALLFCSRKNFLLPPTALGGAVPILQHGGRQVEQGTALGLILRQAIDAQGAGALFPNGVRSNEQEVVGAHRQLRGPLNAMQANQVAVVNALLRGGKPARNAVVRWVCDALVANAAAEAERPDPMRVSSDGFMLNLGLLLLMLSKPFIVDDPEKAKKISLTPSFLRLDESFGAFPEDLTPLSPAASPVPPASSPTNFITQSFFLTWRALHLGLKQQLSKHISRVRYFHYARGQQEGNPMVANLFQQILMDQASVYQPELLEGAAAFYGAAATWLTRVVTAEGPTPRLPEHLVEDVVSFTLHFAGHMSPIRLESDVHLRPVFELAIALLTAGAKIAHSPHLRARLSEVLFEVYLEPSFKPSRGDGRVAAGNGMAHGLLRVHPKAASELAPALLVLYGDVEQTGHEDKLMHRHRIARILKYLYTAGTDAHRQTFQRIAQDREGFVKFANGLMNEANSLVASCLSEILPEIRAFEQQQQDTTAWGRLSEQERTESNERHENNERMVAQKMLLCNDTMDMLTYMTSDKEIQKPFLLPELLPRLASMLLSVLVQLVGSRGLDIKVLNPEKYNFHPRDLVGQVCTTMANFAAYEAFQEAIPLTGYFNADLLPKTVKLVRKIRALAPAHLEALERLVESVNASHAQSADSEDRLGEAPEEFLDPVLYTIMDDPVLLPSGTIVNRPTIMQHLLNDPTDPFSRQPLSADQLVDAVDLKQRIEAWRRK